MKFSIILLPAISIIGTGIIISQYLKIERLLDDKVKKDKLIKKAEENTNNYSDKIRSLRKNITDDETAYKHFQSLYEKDISTLKLECNRLYEELDNSKQREIEQREQYQLEIEQREQHQREIEQREQAKHSESGVIINKLNISGLD